MTDNSIDLTNLLTLTATAVTDTLSAARVDSDCMGFAVVVWKIGKPEKCSSVFGSGSPAAHSESSVALAAASKKSLGPPTRVIPHTTSGRSN